MRIANLLSACLLTTAALSASSDYFPLQAGNQWVLQTETATPDVIQIEVHRSRVVNGQEYFLVSGYAPGDAWIRKSRDGVVYVLEESGGTETRIAHLAFGAPQYRTNLSGCDQIAQPAQASLPYPGPGGPALPVQYNPGLCRDNGLTQEFYTPGVGLSQRSVVTLAGPRTYQLIYARVGDRIITGEARTLVLRYDFAHGSRGWLPGFSDYGLDHSDLRMAADVRAMPEEMWNGRSGFYLQSMNRSDDLFMFLKREVTTTEGLEPNHAYRVAFDIELASDAPTGCVGVGGAPGEGVYLKAGASADEPVSEMDNARQLTMNIDKGQQSAGGKDVGVAGTIENGRACDGGPSPYLPLRKTYVHPEVVRTDNRGALWLVVGTDSAFEGLTGLFYRSITARLTPVKENQ